MFSQQRRETGSEPQYYISNFTLAELQKPAKGQLLVMLNLDNIFLQTIFSSVADIY